MQAAMVRTMVVVAWLAAHASTALAEPAPWYQWRSRVSGVEVCAQTSPGEGWVQSGGPYGDSRCQRRVRRIQL